MYKDHRVVSVDGKLVVSKLPGEPGFKTLSVKDLFSIPLGKPTRIVRPVMDTYSPKELDWDAHFEGAYKRYLHICRLYKPWWQWGWDRRLTRLRDRFRWKLHLKLLEWGVII